MMRKVIEEDKLWDLGGLSRTSLADEDKYLMLLKQLQELIPASIQSVYSRNKNPLLHTFEHGPVSLSASSGC